MSELQHCVRPCWNCPWRRDSVAGEFPAERYKALRATAGSPGAEAGFGAPMFACHKSEPGRDRACAGWLARSGTDHLGVRLAVALGRLPASALQPGATETDRPPWNVVPGRETDRYGRHEYS